MTVRGLWLALAFFASAPVPAAALCHHYSRWAFPYPQRCVVARTGVMGSHFRRPMSPVRAPDLALPALDRPDGGEADEATRARLLLRAALEKGL